MIYLKKIQLLWNKNVFENIFNKLKLIKNHVIYFIDMIIILSK